MNSVLAILIGLMSGAAMSVAVSSVWCVLHLPARIQHLLHAASPRMMGLALFSGLMLAALHNALQWTLGLPGVFGVAAMVVGGMFVGMVASALGEILEVAPVLMRRFRLGDVSGAVRVTILLAKTLGAIIASIAITLCSALTPGRKKRVKGQCPLRGQGAELPCGVWGNAPTVFRATIPKAKSIKAQAAKRPCQ